MKKVKLQESYSSEKQSQHNYTLVDSKKYFKTTQTKSNAENLMLRDNRPIFNNKKVSIIPETGKKTCFYRASA